MLPLQLLLPLPSCPQACIKSVRGLDYAFAVSAAFNCLNSDLGIPSLVSTPSLDN